MAVSDLGIGDAQLTAINLANAITRSHSEHRVVFCNVEAFSRNDALTSTLKVIIIYRIRSVRVVLMECLPNR